MSATPTFRESRRSTRVPLKVAIAVESGAERVTCEGETVVVKLHGALLSTTIELSVGMRISIHVYLTDKPAWCMPTLRTPCAAASNWISHETSGESICRPTTGMRPPLCNFARTSAST